MGILSRVRSRYADFRRVQRRDGTSKAIRSAASYVRDNPRRVISSRGGYQDSRIDLEQRWDTISQHVAPDAKNVLDIGCNQGRVTKKAAESGLFAVGLEKKRTALEDARSAVDASDQCFFINHEVTPDNIDQLPEFDVIFLFAVYYHWGNQFGWSRAESMLGDLGRNADQLFYETPESDEYIHSDRFPAGDGGSIAERHERYLETVFEGDCSIELVGRADYKGEDRSDLIFTITC